MKFTLNIDCDNAAFDDLIGYEVARILRELASRMESDETPTAGRVRDANGNQVGAFSFAEDLPR